MHGGALKLKSRPGRFYRNNQLGTPTVSLNNKTKTIFYCFFSNKSRNADREWPISQLSKDYQRVYKGQIRVLKHILLLHLQNERHGLYYLSYLTSRR